MATRLSYCGFIGEERLDKFHNVCFWIGVHRWSNAQSLLICFGIGFFVLVLGYKIDITLLQKRLYFIEGELVHTKRLIQENKRLVREDEQLQKLNTKEVGSTVKLTKPDINLDRVSVLQRVERALFEAQVEIDVFASQPIKENEWQIIYPIKIEANGHYKNLVGCLSRLIEQRNLVVDEMLLHQRQDDKKANLNMHLLLSVYQDKQNVWKSTINEVSANKELPVSISERDIFKQPNVEVGLYLWSCKELVFHGLIKEAQTIYGIVSDPLGIVYRVSIGDTIGLKQSKVVAINEQGIITSNQTENLVRVN